MLAAIRALVLGSRRVEAFELTWLASSIDTWLHSSLAKTVIRRFGTRTWEPSNAQSLE
jgi:hypothetical protein